MKLIRRFTSKRNEVFLAQTGSSLCVVKRFADREDAKREREIYSLLSESSLLTAKLLFADECELLILTQATQEVKKKRKTILDKVLCF